MNGVGLGQTYMPAVCTFFPFVLGPGAGAEPVFLYEV